MTVIARRIIRSRGSQFARFVGSEGRFDSVADLIKFARTRKRVFAYIDSNGNEGTIRSGRRMRTVDAHVKNTVSASGGIQIPLDFAVALGANPVDNLFDSSEMGTENRFEASNREADKAWAEHLNNS